MISVPDAGAVPEHRAGRSPARTASMRSAGNPSGYKRERIVEADPHHLPVAGGGVLAGRALGRAAGAVPGAGRGVDPSDRRQEPEPERGEVRGPDPADRVGRVRERVRSLVPVGRRVRCVADAPRVADHDQHARDQRRRHRRPPPACSRCTARPTAAPRAARARSAGRTARRSRRCRPPSSPRPAPRRGGSIAARARPRSPASAPRCCALDPRTPRPSTNSTSSESGSAPCDSISAPEERPMPQRAPPGAGRAPPRRAARSAITRARAGGRGDATPRRPPGGAGR